MDICTQIAQEMHIRVGQVQTTVKLLDEGNTIPFIARYRKEATGSLDDTVLRDLYDRLTYLRNLQKRREEIASSIEGQEKMTSDIQKAIDNAKTLAELEDIYRPFKQKRRTRASIAKEKGLEPLASEIFAQNRKGAAPKELAEAYINPEKGVETIEDALQGANDIIAEQVSDDAGLRKKLRALLYREGLVVSKAAKEEDSVYATYYDFSQPVNKIAGHRVLAIDRGERENMLKVSIQMDENRALQTIYDKMLLDNTPCYDVVKQAIDDSYRRLIFPSLENEIRSMLTENASEQAISVFSMNLRHLLMQPPVKGAVTLGLDPAYRTGCKIAVVDETGKVLDTTVIYPTPPQNKKEEAKKTLKALIAKHHVTVIAIGNGTASKESEMFVAELIAEVSTPLAYMVVSEAGASVYSASKLAAEEFPQFDVSLRSAVSIARRLQDPLAELVKIDPKAIGVGQYQHDMPKNRMDTALGGVVEGCVNQVGVDLNTASFSLLSYIAGINSTVAKNIVAYREECGRFANRKQLLKVAKLGPKAYEQCAGFLRIDKGDNVLDSTGVHPESYKAAQELLAICGFTLNDVQNGAVQELPARVKAHGEDRLAKEIGIGEPTLRDIVAELVRPGRDPRDELPKPLLRTDVMDLKDLKPGMELTGTVRNVIDFGAFVDIGVHEDGLVHVSQLSSQFIRHPSQVVKVGDIVKVKVLEVDVAKKRISLTMKGVSQTIS